MSFFDQFSEQELEVLRQRAERAANISENNDTRQMRSVLQISLGGELYALPVKLLKAIYEDINVISVPCTPDFVAGIANVRGRIIPVVDLGILLDTPRMKFESEPVLVVVTRDNVTLGFQVDYTGEMITLPAEDTRAVPVSGDLQKTEYLQGLLSSGEVLLNIDAILNDPDLIVDQTPK